MNTKSEKKKSKKNKEDIAQDRDENLENHVDYEDEDDWKPRKKKDGGKRSHRKRTIKDDFWDQY